MVINGLTYLNYQQNIDNKWIIRSICCPSPQIEQINFENQVNHTHKMSNDLNNMAAQHLNLPMKMQLIEMLTTLPSVK